MKKSQKHNKPSTRTTKKFFPLFTTNGIKIQNFNTQIQNKAQQTRTKGSNVNYQYHIQFTKSLFIQQWINFSGFFNLGSIWFLQTKSEIRTDLTKNWTWKPNQIRERKNPRRPRLDWREKKSRDPDQIGERAHRVDRQIQKTQKPTKHNSPVWAKNGFFKWRN